MWDHPGLDDIPSDPPVCWSTVSGRAPGKGSVVTADLAPSNLAGKGTPATSMAQSQQGGIANASPKWWWGGNYGLSAGSGGDREVVQSPDTPGLWVQTGPLHPSCWWIWWGLLLAEVSLILLTASWHSFHWGFFFFLIIVFIYLFWAVLGLPCCIGFCLVVASRGCSPVALHGLLMAVASLVEHVFWGTQGSVGVALGLGSCAWLLGSRAQAQ